MVFRFRWLQEKAAVEFSSRIIQKKTGKSYNSGSKIMSLNAGTGQLQVFGYGYDGDVYFSNTGSMERRTRSIETRSSSWRATVASSRPKCEPRATIRRANPEAAR